MSLTLNRVRSALVGRRYLRVAKPRNRNTGQMHSPTVSSTHRCTACGFFAAEEAPETHLDRHVARFREAGEWDLIRHG